MAKQHDKDQNPVPVSLEGPNAVLPPYDDGTADMLSNDHMEATEPAEPGAAPLVVLSDAPKPTSEDRMTQIAEAMLKIAEGQNRILERQEATRQLTINEVKPDSPFNPEGKRVRAGFTRPTSLHGIPLNPLLHTEEEIRLWNKLKPGRYIDRKVEVRMTTDGSIDLSWPGGKTDARIEMYSRFNSLTVLLTQVIAEREQKEERRRKGIFGDDEAIVE